MAENQEYVSGRGAASELPPELRTWNWGAFLMNWIWGLGNNTYIALLALVPPLFPIMLIVLGIKGNKWAWQNQVWISTEQFRATQRRWAIAGLICWLAFISFIGFVALLIMGVNLLLKGEAYEQSLTALKNNPEVIQITGEPIEPGFFVGGNISVKGSTGKANISYSVSGPKGQGDVFVKALKEHGSWTLNEVTFVHDEKKIKVK